MRLSWVILLVLAQGCAGASVKPELYNSLQFFTNKSTSTRKDGFKLTMECTGNGPSEDLSRKEALDSCRQTAIDVASNEIVTKTLLVETEHSSSYHSEISQKYSVVGLDCDNLRSFTENVDGYYISSIRCEFDLSKAKFVPIKDPVSKTFSYILGENRNIILTSVPPCQDVLIIGKNSRTVSCKSITSVLVYPNDQEVIVRAKDRIPKHIQIQSVKSRTLEVYLERM